VLKERRKKIIHANFLLFAFMYKKRRQLGGQRFAKIKGHLHSGDAPTGFSSSGGCVGEVD
jgi:hypothetical protein